MIKPQPAETHLEYLTGQWVVTRRIADAVCAVWPEHMRYISKSLARRDVATMRTAETEAEAALILAKAV